MLITILMFIFSKFSQSYFFAQIWSQNLKFSKLTEIWCKGTLLYVYYDFNVYFFKSFVSQIILGKFSHKIWFCPNWLEFSICVHYQYYMLIIIESSNFSKFSCSKYYNQISFHPVFSKLTEIHCDMLITNFIFIFSIFFRSVLCNYINNIICFKNLKYFWVSKKCKSDGLNSRIMQWTSRTRTQQFQCYDR